MIVQTYETGSVLLKAIGEPIRLQILDILSNGEMCACDILQNLSISQPTLSHHMKALTASGWVNARKKATWMYYSVNRDTVQKMYQYMIDLTTQKPEATDRIIISSCTCCEPDDDTSNMTRERGRIS
ncbi:MAG: metalloregulator ArsR/SmtB family transcription factor [Bacillota bacterium]|nr:metalloregulator ArsR/SmtB family transcription factor [Bacillota bacterium]